MRFDPENLMCSKTKRVWIDFNDLARSKDNPIMDNGIWKYPYKISSMDGTSYVYRISKDYYFKRKQQDGNLTIKDYDNHIQYERYNEFVGTFDDLAEVICYYLAKDITKKSYDKEGNVVEKPIIENAEYQLASYEDEYGQKMLGCITKNICDEEHGEVLLRGSEILKYSATSQVNSIENYRSQIQKYCADRNIIPDHDVIEKLILNSYFCWKVANSDNHSHNIMFIKYRRPDGRWGLRVAPQIDNGSAYMLCAPYVEYDSESQQVNSKYSMFKKSDKFSRVDENGDRVLFFRSDPFKHDAFKLNYQLLNGHSTILAGEPYKYEYALASEAFSDINLYNDIYQVEQQFDLDKAISEIDEQYGTLSKGETQKHINWPLNLKEIMQATDEFKRNILSYVFADYFCYVAYNSWVGKVDDQNPSDEYRIIKEKMTTLPIQEDPRSYAEAFLAFAQQNNIKINPEKLRIPLIFKGAAQKLEKEETAEKNIKSF